jgi:hypothetical protein
MSGGFQVAINAVTQVYEVTVTLSPEELAKFYADQAKTKVDQINEIADGLPAAVNAGLDSINEAKQTALDDISQLKDDSLSEINTAKTEGVDAVNTAKTEGVNTVDTAKTEGVDAVNTAKTEGVDAVNTAKTTAISEINPLVTAAQTAKQGAEDAETRIEGIEQNVILLEGQAQQASTDATTAASQAVPAAQQAQNALNAILANVATFTVELLGFNETVFFAPLDLRINSATAIVGTPSQIIIEVNGQPYTFGDLITQGSAIRVFVNIGSVLNLSINYE